MHALQNQLTRIQQRALPTTGNREPALTPRVDGMGPHDTVHALRSSCCCLWRAHLLNADVLKRLHGKLPLLSFNRGAPASLPSLTRTSHITSPTPRPVRPARPSAVWS